MQPLAGKPVLDATNYIPQRDGRIPGQYDGPPSSEVLQQHLPTAHVVKVFNNIPSWHLRSLARPAGAIDRSALPIAGDDPAAKEAVTRFLDAIGYDTARRAADARARRRMVGSRRAQRIEVVVGERERGGRDVLFVKRSALPFDHAPDGPSRGGPYKKLTGPLQSVHSH